MKLYTKFDISDSPRAGAPRRSDSLFASELLSELLSELCGMSSPDSALGKSGLYVASSSDAFTGVPPLDSLLLPAVIAEVTVTAT